MAWLSDFTNQYSRYWPIPYHVGPLLLFPVTLICTLYWIFLSAAFIWSTAYEKQHFNSGAAASGVVSPPIRWSHPLECDKSIIGTNLFPIGLEVVHIPLHTYLYVQNQLHPGLAFSLALLMAANWAVLVTFQILANQCAETRFPSVWQGLFYTRVVLGVMLAVVYLMYLGVAGAAIGARREENRKRRDMRNGHIRLEEMGKKKRGQGVERREVAGNEGLDVIPE